MDAKNARRGLAVLLGWAAGAAPLHANEAIDSVNNQESLAGGIAPLHASEVAASAGGAPGVDTASGTRFVFGYEAARTRTLLGIPDLYTDFDLTLGVATLRYAGLDSAPPAGAGQPLNQAATYVEEELRLRLGKSFALFPARRWALTPFVGISQKAWARDATATGSATFYDQGGAEAGVLAQASLPGQFVLGVDAAVGRVLAAVITDGAGNQVTAKAVSYALHLDHRTFPDWHQRLELRQGTLRYAPAAGSGVFEPQRTSGLTILFSVGGEVSVL